MSSASVMACITHHVYCQVNAMCKHFVENSQMHETASRLFEAIQHATKGRVDGFSSPGDAAAFLGQSAATITNWKVRGVSKDGQLSAHEKFGVNPTWIAKGAGEMFSQAGNASGNFAPINLSPAAGVGNVSEIKKRAVVPLISWVQAGEFSEVLDIFHPGEAVQWEEAYFSSPSKRAYALLVEGDSMDRGSGSPNFPAGTILIVDPDRASHAGDYVIAKDVATQRATFKQLVTDGARWYLRPLNPVYPTIEIDDPALRVIGRVIEFKPPGGKL